jgi:hypothetical protein
LLHDEEVERLDEGLFETFLQLIAELVNDVLVYV